jgi:hypothetical protein
MKQLIIFLMTGIILVSCNETDKKPVANANLDSLANVAMADSSKYTTIQWLDSVNRDLGKIKQGQIVEVEWHFKNTGNKPLIISNVSAGCGCTVAEKPQAPIAPGKEDFIKAQFNSKNQHIGENQKTVTVVANTMPQTSYTLSFRVEITNK